jgi:hypothetical protein
MNALHEAPRYEIFFCHSICLRSRIPHEPLFPHKTGEKDVEEKEEINQCHKGWNMAVAACVQSGIMICVWMEVNKKETYEI